MAKLDRTLGLTGLVAVSIGAMLGGSIFVLPAVAAQITGQTLWLAFLLAALLVLPAALTKSELATALPASGGSYVYIERCLGPLAGTIGGIGLSVSLLLKASFALLVLGAYLNLLVDVPVKPVALAVLALVVMLNLAGLRKLGKVQLVIVAICLSVLVVLIIGGLFRAAELPAPEGPQMPGGFGGLMAAVGLVFFSYAGVTKIAAIAEEVEDPSRNIPRGMIFSIGFITFIYVGISWVLVHLFDVPTLAADTTPIASLAELLHGRTGLVVLSVTAVLALAGMANTGILAASRFPFAMSRDRLLPSALMKVNPRSGAPVASVLLTGGFMAASILFLDVVKVAKLCSSFKIAAFAANHVALLVMREGRPEWYRPGFKIPFYPWLPIFGLVTGIALLVAMGPVALIGLGAGVALGGAAYFFYGRHKVAHIGVLRQMMHRSDLVQAPESSLAIPFDEHIDDSFGVEEAAHEAHTTVALFGRETSAEALVHLGATLAGDRTMEVLRIEELPEHGEIFTTSPDRDDRILSLKRRVLALAEERGVDVHFDDVLSRDVRRTLYEYANRQHSRWVVMAWTQSKRRGLHLRDPFAWLLGHLEANVAVLKDAGIRTYRKILVLAEPGPHDVLVVRTADQLADLFHAKVTLGRFLPASSGEDEEEVVRTYHEELSGLCGHVGGAEILRGDDEVATVVKASARFDLLIFGAPPEAPLRDMFFGSRQDHIMEQAHCAVLRLRTPRSEIHEALEPMEKKEANEFSLADFLETGVLAPDLDVSRKEDLFTAMASRFAELTGDDDASTIEEAFWARERQQNTAVGDGVALPHATVDTWPETRLGIFTLARPVPFGHVDGGEVDVCLSTVGPSTDRNTHLYLLSAVAKLIQKGDLLDELRTAMSAAEVETALRHAESRLA